MGYLSSITAAAGVSLIAAAGLAYASLKYRSESNPRAEAIKQILPGANCGACGAAGCDAFADGVVEKRYSPGGCVVGGEAVARKIGDILGVAVTADKRTAKVQCGGTSDRSEYHGLSACYAASAAVGGQKSCKYGCLGFGDCLRACSFGAITMNGLPKIDLDKCTGCAKCSAACPRNIILVSSGRVHIACSSRDNANEVVKVCKTGCIACGICAAKCPNKAIEIRDNLAVIDYAKCRDCMVCIRFCPRKAIRAS
ncbi:MAG: RnfABCDGE type electron transport complex subunit B [archaeon]